jgi:hypothetical protein
MGDAKFSPTKLTPHSDKAGAAQQPGGHIFCHAFCHAHDVPKGKNRPKMAHSHFPPSLKFGFKPKGLKR